MKTTQSKYLQLDSDDYILNGKDKVGVIEGRDPKVTVKLGDKLTFNVDAFGHPFYLKTLRIGNKRFSH